MNEDGGGKRCLKPLSVLTFYVLQLQDKTDAVTYFHLGWGKVQSSFYIILVINCMGLDVISKTLRNNLNIHKLWERLNYDPSTLRSSMAAD